jgi:hypothetical protein
MLAEAKAAAGGGDSRLVLAFGSNQRDIDAARQLKELLPAAEMDQRPAYRTHNILNEAYGTGQLRGLLEDWFG